MNPYSKFVDALTDRVGRLVAWLSIIMILVGAYNAIARYAGRFTGLNLSSNLYLELQWYLFSVIFLLGAAYSLKEDSHVRVDILYAKRTPKGKALTNILGGVFLLVPFCIFVLWTSWPTVRDSFAVLETSPDPGGLIRYPLKALILVCFVLLLMQGISQLLKDFATLRGPDSEANSGETPLEEELGGAS